ncbi:MAG: polysaccharide biosynthesis/export family protein [Deltaproteobacteria bacterium]|nr:polysaccharide biosynthesis/export family protein [Deltaproteobacteria bacterium]
MISLLLFSLTCSALSATPRAESVTELRLPTDEAAAFGLGPGDRISLKVYRHSDLDTELIVAPDGTVTLPLLGRVEVTGRSYSALIGEVEAGLQDFYTDASVSINVLELASQKVMVVGEVSNPVVLPLGGEMTALEALVRAGGISQDARTKNVLLIRSGGAEPELYLIDVKGLIAGDLAQNVRMLPGDILVVPTKTIVKVERYFRHVQAVIGPVVSGSQIYRNFNLGATGPVIEDNVTGR